MSVNIQATIGVCAEYRNEAGKKSQASVVISPIKVIASEDGTRAKVVTGCNLWKACHNTECFFSFFSQRNDQKKK
jgi:hypothetical protein